MSHPKVFRHKLLFLVLAEREVGHTLNCLGLWGFYLYWESLSVAEFLSALIFAEAQDSLELFLDTLFELLGLGRFMSQSDRNSLYLGLSQSRRFVCFNIIITLLGQGRGGIEKGDVVRDVLQLWFLWLMETMPTGWYVGLRGFLGDGKVGPLALLA